MSERLERINQLHWCWLISQLEVKDKEIEEKQKHMDTYVAAIANKIDQLTVAREEIEKLKADKFRFDCNTHGSKYGTLAVVGWACPQCLENLKARNYELHEAITTQNNERINELTAANARIGALTQCQCDTDVGFICDVCLLPKFRVEITAANAKIVKLEKAYQRLLETYCAADTEEK